MCCCRKQLLPIRQIAFGHIDSRSDIAVRMDRTSEVRLREEYGRECLDGSRQYRAALSSRPADHEQSRRRLPRVSSQNDSDDGATFACDYSSLICCRLAKWARVSGLIHNATALLLFPCFRSLTSNRGCSMPFT